MQTIPCVCDMLKMGSAIREFSYLEVYGTVAVRNAGYKNSHAEEKTEYCGTDIHTAKETRY